MIVHRSCVLLHGLAADVGSIVMPESVDALVTDPPGGIGFMGKSWDGDRGGRDAWVAWLAEQMAPSFAALKPGAFGLVWALPRTSHWTACALEACGFVIRDRVSHLFGTGFPKSLNIGKAIDSHLGVDRPVVGSNPNHRPESGVEYEGVYAGGNTGAAEVTAAGSPQAAEWEGWGTALKPACEDWWLVQKPFRGTYAENVLAHGVGGLNIDGCRIDGAPRDPGFVDPSARADGWGMQRPGLVGAAQPPGRWPAHIVLSHLPDCGDACAEGCAVRLLDEQSGARTSGRKMGGRYGRSPDIYKWGSATDSTVCYADSGGASRFFYVAKAPRKQKDAGLDHLPARSGGDATGRVDGSAGTANPRAGAGRTGGARNIHPTVKSVELMRWLVRLITPPGGIILDPFAGSGTTGVAAIEEGMTFVGVEAGGDENEYLPIVEGRLRDALRAA